MALKDCLGKMEKAGTPVSKADTVLLEQWIDQGLTDDEVLQRYDLHINKTLFDITKAAQDKGAPVSVRRDIVGEVRSFGTALLAKSRTRLVEVRNQYDELNNQLGEIDFVQSEIKNWALGGPAIDLADDGILVVRFEQMLWRAGMREVFAAGMFMDGQIKGKDAYEIFDSFRAMQARGEVLREGMQRLFEEEVDLIVQIDSLTDGQGIQLDADTGEYLLAPTPPDKPDGVSEESWSYTWSTGPQAPAKKPFTVKTGKGAKGDLYLQRVGPNAGTVHRERQGPSDMAISLDTDVLLPDYMFYFLQYLQPQMQGRAHGTAQQAINKRDVEEVITKAFQNMVKEDSGDVYADNQAKPDQRVEEAVANYKAIVRVQEEREIRTGITKVVTANDAAHVLAEIRKNASEGFWALVLDKDDNVVGVVEHGRGTIDGTSVYPSTYAGAVHTIPGAAKVWMAHNHPSGVLTASQPDMRITDRISKLLDGSDVKVMGHVLMGGSTTKFTLMDKSGRTIASDQQITPAPRNKKVKVFTRKLVGKQEGVTVRSPAEMQAVLARMGNPEGVLMLNNRHIVLGFMSMTAEEMKVLKRTGGSGRVIRALAEMNAAAFVVSTKTAAPAAANNMGAFANASDWRMLDAIYTDTNGTVRSMASEGTLAPPSTFFQTEEGTTVPGLHSGLMVAAQTMPRNSGTVEEMINLLKKQPGVSKVQKPLVDEDGRKIYAQDRPSKKLRIKLAGGKVVEVLQNPTNEQFRLFRQAIRMEYKEKGWNVDADPLSRNTWDENGNRFVWPSTDAPHNAMESALAEQLGVKDLDQNNQGKTGKRKQAIETTYPELDWLLLEEYFTERGGTVTQDELIAFIRQNGIKIVETMYGGEHVPTPELTTDLVDLDEVYERYNLDPDSRFDDGEIIFSSFDFHSQRSYEIIYDPQMGTAGVTGDEGKTWLPVSEPGPFLMRQAGQDQQRAAIMSAENAIELDIITKEKGKFAGTSQWAGGSQVLDGGKFDREILLRTPKVKTGGVEFSGNLVGPSLGIDLTEQEFNHIKDAVYLNPNINDRTTVGRINNDSGDLIGVTFDNLLPEDYQDFADEMSNLSIRMTDEQNNIQQVRSRIHEGGDPILERQIENFDGSHWEEPNVFAWIRVSTRIGANGEKILFIEELQSDIHQRGSRIGYREPIPQIPKFKIEKRGEFWVPVTEDGGILKYNGRIIPPTRDQKAGADEATNLQEAKLRTDNILAQMHSTLERDQVDKLPQLPFKGNAWVTLAIKRIIRMAAEEGFDQIGFITGEDQAIRNGQAEAIGEIQWNPVTKELAIWNTLGEITSGTINVDEANLTDHMSLERANDLKALVQERNNLVDVEPALGVLDDFVPADFTFAEEIDINDYDANDLATMAENGELFTAVDVNGELLRAFGGDIVIAQTEEAMRDYVNEQLFPTDGSEDVALTGLNDVTMTAAGEGNVRFYDSTSPRLAQKAARKLDRDASVRLNGQTIHTRDGAPFTIELEKVVQPGSPPALQWFLFNDEGRKVAGPYPSEERATTARDDLNNITATIHVMDMTEKMTDNAMEGQTFHQKKRGAISFDEARRGVIKLTETRDLSTFMHEAGHLYLEIMGGLAEDANTPQQIKDDYAKILEYLGVSSREEIGRKEHEKWAESFEKYLHEGNAPSVALQSAFNAYRRWLSDIWKRMKGDSPDGIILTEEIRGVMDRILASDDQIAVAQATQEFSAVFQTAEQMGVSQQVFDAYKHDILKATNEAVEKETARLMAAQGREQRAWWRDELAKLRLIVEQEAWDQQVYKAFALLAHGKQPNGESLEQGSPFKIDKASLLALLQDSKTTLARLPKPWVYTVKGGLDVDVAAKELGYRDGMALITALLEMPNMKDWIDIQTKERLEAMFPDPLLDGSISENAIMAVHNEARANVLATEMRELRKLMKRDRAIVGATKKETKEQATLSRLANKGMLPKRDELKLIKQFAKATMGKLRIMDVRPEVYLNAERKAGRLAFEAAARGDYEKAYNFKRQQTVNHELYRAAVRAKKETTGWRNYLAKFSKPRVIQRLGKLGVIEPILAVIEGIQLKKVTLKSIERKTALQMLAQQIHDGQVVTPIAEHLYRVELDKQGNEVVVLNEAPFKNWQEMTVDELHAMRDIVKQLEHQAKRKLEMPVNGEMVVMDDAILELTEQVLEVNEVVDLGVGTKGLKQRVEKGWTSGIAHWLGPSVMARILDAQEWGATTRLIIVNIRRAVAEKLVPMQQKALSEVSQIYLKFYAKGTLNWRTKELRLLDKKGFATINGESLSKGDVISIALNMGNEGNKSALFNGMRIDDKVAYPEDQVMDALAKLDANDWHFVQAIWDYLDSYWEALAAMERERRGIAPERVEHVPFTVETADGKTINMKGGYMPLSYNYEHSERHEERQFEDHYKSMRNSSFLAANTRAGATHNRVKNHNMVVQLGLFQIEKHLKEITRDIAIGDEVNFASNLLQNKAYRKAMKQTGNATSLKELELWLTDAAVGELPANNMVERRMAWLRVGFTVSKLAFNVYTTVLQLTGIFQSMASIGSGNMAMGAGRVLRNPYTAWRDAFKVSKFLQTRYGWKSQAFDKDIHDAAGVLSEYGPGLPTTRRRIRSNAARLMFMPIAKMQQIVDVITWYGALWKARNSLGLGDQEAVHYADAQVELAQTSGFFSDRSGIERGTLSATTRQQQFIRLWTTLISYMQRKGGIAYMKTQELKRDMSILTATQYAIDMMLLFTAEGIASAMLYDRWDWEEDDPEKVLAAAAKETLLSIAAGIPFVREFQSAIYGSGNTPIGAVSKDLVTLYIQAMQGEMDPALRKAFVNSMGTLFHLPASQTNRLLEALIDEDDPELLEYFTGTRD